MENRNFYNEILTEHNLRPAHKHDLPDANLVLEGVNPSCGDDIWLKLKPTTVKMTVTAEKSQEGLRNSGFLNITAS